MFERLVDLDVVTVIQSDIVNVRNQCYLYWRFLFSTCDVSTLNLVSYCVFQCCLKRSRFPSRRDQIKNLIDFFVLVDTDPTNQFRPFNWRLLASLAHTAFWVTPNLRRVFLFHLKAFFSLRNFYSLIENWPRNLTLTFQFCCQRRDADKRCVFNCNAKFCSPGLTLQYEKQLPSLVLLAL